MRKIPLDPNRIGNSVGKFLRKKQSDLVEYLEKKRRIENLLGKDSEKHIGIIVNGYEVEALYYLLHAQQVRGYISYLTMYPDLVDAVLHHEELILPVSELILCDISHVEDLEERDLLHVEFSDPRDKMLDHRGEVDYQNKEFKEFSRIWTRLSVFAHEEDVQTLFLIQKARYYDKFFRRHSLYSGQRELLRLALMHKKQFFDWWRAVSAKSVFEAVKSDEKKVVEMSPELWNDTINPITADLCLSYMVRMPVMFYWEESMYANLILSKLTERTEEALTHVTRELQRVRSEVYSALIARGLIAPSTVDVKIPLSLLLILGQLPDNAKASDFSEALLNLREEGCVRKFRQWIGRYQDAIANVDLRGILEAEKELQRTAINLRNEFLGSVGGFEVKSLVATPEILVDLADQKYATAGAKITRQILEHIPFLEDKLNHRHLTYMHRLVKGGLRITNLENELSRCFGDEGRAIAMQLKYILDVSAKVEELRQRKS